VQVVLIDGKLAKDISHEKWLSINDQAGI